MIQARITGDDAVPARLKAVPGKVRDALAGRVGRLALALQQQVQADKLSGQMLQVRSGRLRDSIEVAIEQDDRVVTGRVFSAAPQAARFEFGLHGSETVAAQLRTIKQAFGRPLRQGAKRIAISSYSRRVDVAARPFLRGALEDMTGEIRAGLARLPDIGIW